MFAVTAQEVIKSEQISEFKKLDFAGQLKVTLIKGDATSIEIKINNSTIDKLKWGVNNGVLSIKLKPTPSAVSSAEVTLYYKDINAINVSEATVATQGALKASMLDISASSNASVVCELDVTDLALKASGRSAVKLAGTDKYIDIKASSSAKVDTKELNVMNAEVSASSSAEVYVYSSERINMNAATGGAIYYKGEPMIVRFSTNTMGTVNSIGK